MESIKEKYSLNNEQLEAVITTDGPVLIIAGAGTGKTKTLTSRTAHLIDLGTNPENILMLTFTNKAAQEMKDRIKSHIGEKGSSVQACTYHSFSYRLLKKYHSQAGLKPFFQVINASYAKDILTIIRNQNKIRIDDSDFPTIDTIAGIISRQKNKKETIPYIIKNFFPKFKIYESDILKINNDYESYNKEHDFIDYDDVLIYVNRLLETHTEIAKQISDAYKYVMVDEYQDSNKLQYDFLRLIRQFDNKNLCVVGDDLQSIYAFRGANFQNIIDFPNQFEGCKVIKLIRNYRSTQQILDFANNTTKFVAEGYYKDLKGLKEGEKPRIIVTEDKEAQYGYVLQEISGLLKKGADPSEIAVLARSNNSLSALELLFLRVFGHKVKYKRYGGLPFVEREHIRDVLSFLIASERKDEISWWRILKLHRNIGEVNAEKISKEIEEKGTDGLIDDKFSKRIFYPELVNLHAFITAHKEEPGERLNKIINDYYVPLRQKNIAELKTKNANEKAQRRKELENDIKDFQILLEMAKKYKNIDALIDAFTFNEENDDEKALILSTVHSAKGLEFDTVFVLDCYEGMTPFTVKPASDTEAAEREAQADMEEQRRLFYVCVTRAKTNLYLMYPTIAFKPLQISRYLTEGDAQSLCSCDTVEVDNTFIPRKKISFELIPEPLWGKNLREFLTPEEWNRISHKVREKGVCSACGRKSDLHAHERWTYDDKKHIQILKEIVPLCDDCHNATHIGHAIEVGEDERARKWYCRVNDISSEDELKEEIEADLLWKDRSEFSDWGIEIDIATIKKITGFEPSIKDKYKKLFKGKKEYPASEAQKKYVNDLLRRAGRTLKKKDLTMKEAGMLIDTFKNRGSVPDYVEKLLIPLAN